MTDRIDTSTGHLRIDSHRAGAVIVSIGKMHEGLALGVLTRDLLAMIDAADPDAMRAYLRETTAAEALDAVPEADSPEDVDERPGRDDPTERAQIDRAWAMEHAAAVLGRLVAATGAESGELPVTGYASWILTGSTETLDR